MNEVARLINELKVARLINESKVALLINESKVAIHLLAGPVGNIVLFKRTI